MKASECLTKPGDVARRERDGALAIKVNENWARIYLSDNLYRDNCLAQVQQIADDWTPLAAETPIEGLPSYELVFNPDLTVEERLVEAGKPLGWIKPEDLESVALTKEADAEKVAQLQVKLEAAEDRANHWEEENIELRKIAEKYNQLVQDDCEGAWVEATRYNEQRAELATLREQGQYVLGEPLTPGTVLQPYTRVLREVDGKLWQHEWSMKVNVPADWVCYLDPRPLPTLPKAGVPEPEDSELVKWFDAVTMSVGLNAQGAFYAVDLDKARAALKGAKDE